MQKLTLFVAIEQTFNRLNALKSKHMWTKAHDRTNGLSNAERQELLAKNTKTALRAQVKQMLGRERRLHLRELAREFGTEKDKALAEEESNLGRR